MSRKQREGKDLEVNEILDAIRYNKGRFAREATLAAIEKREEITPHLLGILEETIRDAHRLAEETRYMAHMYAVHLLAQFRERQAYPLLARPTREENRRVSASAG